MDVDLLCEHLARLRRELVGGNGAADGAAAPVVFPALRERTGRAVAALPEAADAAAFAAARAAAARELRALWFPWAAAPAGGGGGGAGGAAGALARRLEPLLGEFA